MDQAATHRVSRRDFLGAASASLMMSAALAGCATAAAPGGGLGSRVVLRGGVVLTMDPALGDFERGDVLIEAGKIAAVGRNLTATASEIDASGTIVMPGFVDTHRHIWQGQLRNILPNGRLDPDYFRDIGGTARSVYRPEDVYAGGLLSAWGAMNAGITTLLDWSHISNTPEHSDAAIRGLRESGIRAVYAYGTGGAGPQNKYPGDARRLRQQYFSSGDQLLTFALATGLDPKHWAAARDVGAPITVHVNGTDQLLPLAKLMGPDVTYIHCCNLSPKEWSLIADTGGGVSIAGPIEMEMGHGVPPFQQVLDRKIPLALSNDVETEIPTEFFTQMRTAFFLQRMLVFQRERAREAGERAREAGEHAREAGEHAREAGAPPLMTVKQVVEVATLGGARVNHLDRTVGSLTPGKAADVILLRADAVNVMPLNHAYGAIVLGMDTSNVDTVFVGGQLKKYKGALVGVDVASLRRQAEQSRDWLLTQAKWPSTVLGGYLPGH